MKNTRTLISSSLVSFIIVLLGLFMLCMSRAPKISFDEPLVEGGGVAYDSVGIDDEDFLKLLDDENNEMTLTENNQESSSEDDDILSLLNGDDAGTDSYDQSSEAGDEGMDEILRLLELDEDAGAESKTNSEDDDLAQILSDTESGETVTQPEASTTPEMEAIDKLSQEVEHLENVLADKTTSVESLRVEIDQYDQRINQYSTQGSSAGGNRTPVQPISYYESTPSEESTYNADVNYRGTYASGDYEESYNTALSLFQSHQYQQAVDVFFQLLQQNSGHPLADNCQYWLGECCFAQGKYYQAVVEFNKVFAHDAPDKQDDAQLMLGLAYLKLGEMTCARSEFDWLVSCYASSEYVNTAHRYLGQL